MPNRHQRGPSWHVYRNRVMGCSFIPWPKPRWLQFTCQVPVGGVHLHFRGVITAGVLPAVTRGGPGCIYTPLPSRGWKRNCFAMGEPTFSWYDGCTFGHMKLGGDHASLKATGWNALLKTLSGAEPSPSQCLWGSWRKTGGTHGALPPAIDIQPAGWGGATLGVAWSAIMLGGKTKKN